MKLFRVLFFVASGSYPIDVVTKLLVKLFSKSQSVESPGQVTSYFLSDTFALRKDEFAFMTLNEGKFI